MPGVGACNVTPASCESRQLVEIQPGVVSLVGLQQFAPGDFPARVRRLAAQNGAERRLHTRSSLVVKLSAGDALDESLVLFGVGVLDRAASLSQRQRLRRVIFQPVPRFL